MSQDTTKIMLKVALNAIAITHTIQKI